MIREIKPVKFFRQKRQHPDHRFSNWFSAAFMLKVTEHSEGGNQIMLTAGTYHKSFWMREFELTEDQFDKLIVN